MSIVVFGNESLIHHAFYSLLKDSFSTKKISIEEKKNFQNYLPISNSILVFLLDNRSEFDFKVDYSKNKVIVISLIKDLILDVSWFQSGLKAILDCKSDFFELKLAIKQLENDKMYVSHNFTNDILQYNVQKPTKEVISNSFILTKREFQIIDYLKKGHTSKEIGNILHISNRTIDKHKNNIFKKLEVNNIVGLINKMKEIES